MKNVDVIQMFIDGENRGATKNLYIENDKLINYGTVLAVREYANGDYQFRLNMTKYSSSTSTIQNKMHAMIPDYQIVSITDNAMMGIRHLL